MSKNIQYPSHWTDMSNYLVHFAKGKGAGKGISAAKLKSAHDPGYWTMLSILSGAELKPGGAFGIGRKLAPNTEQQEVVCFSEIPPGEWLRLSERRKSAFGIGFSKQFIAQRGGGPVWYARNGSDQNKALKKLMKLGADDPENPIWRITAMIDAPGSYGWSSYEYEWEREWRHIGKLTFEPADVAFLFIPEELHAQARAFFSDVYHNNTGPSYFCPFIDARWSRSRVEEELHKDPIKVPPDLPSYEERYTEWDDGNGSRGSVRVTRLRRLQKE
jgi:hypothetical protein